MGKIPTRYPAAAAQNRVQKSFEKRPALSLPSSQQLSLFMKYFKNVTAAILAFSTLIAPFTAMAADQTAEKKAKPYLLKTCAVSDEKLGSMGKPVVYVHEGREIQFCCKACVKDFKKNPAKYVKKIEEAEGKIKKKV